MARKTTLQKVKEIAEKFDGKVRRRYSGRGMFGTYCYGVVVDRYEIDKVRVNANQRKMGWGSVDSMGRDSAIVYWPHLEDKGEDMELFTTGDSDE